MALLDYPLNDPRNPILCQEDIYLRYPRSEDHEAWATLRDGSRAHLQPFEPVWHSEELSRSNFRKRLRVYARDIRAGATRPYFVFRAKDDALVGGCTLSNIRYKAAMTGTIGYWIGASYVRHGYGFAAVCAVLTHGFERLGLERFEAACLPCNTASIMLLRKAGFREEGLAREYLQINGRRQDHLLLGLVPDDFAKVLSGLVKGV